MNRILFLLPLFIFGISFAYAEPLENVQTTVLNYDGISATILLDWSDDPVVSKYEIGCVSCIPNIVQYSIKSDFKMSDVTTFPNSSKRNALHHCI